VCRVNTSISTFSGLRLALCLLTISPCKSVCSHSTYWCRAAQSFSCLLHVYKLSGFVLSMDAQTTAAQKDGSFNQSLPTFWIRHSMHEIAVPSPGHPSAADEAWYWLNRVLCSGSLCATYRPFFKGDVLPQVRTVHRISKPGCVLRQLAEINTYSSLMVCV